MTDHRDAWVLPTRRYLDVDPDSLPFVIEKTVAFVPRLGLCTMCGACEGVCPVDAVAMEVNRKKGIPEPVIDFDACTECELCVRVCPGFELDLKGHLTKDEQASRPVSKHFGHFHEIFRMRSTNDEFSRHGSSGGMVTATAAHLLASGRVDGVIVTRMVEGRWNETEAIVARSDAELVTSQKSKYQPNPLARVLKKVIRGEIADERLGFVGLPCHIEALRLAQKAFPVLEKRIGWVMSIFCSRVPSIHATEFLLRRHGVDPDRVQTLEYRSGEHPGHLTTRTRDGVEVTVDHLHWSYWGHAYLQFFWPTRCFMCYDKTGEQAEISFGDNWQQLGIESLGASSVIARSPRAAELMLEIEVAGEAVITNTVSADELVAGQDLIRKRLMGNRFWWMRKLGRKTPIYYDEFEVERSSLMRTFRVVRHVLMAEHHLPSFFMRLYIRGSWAKKWLRTRFPDKVRSVFSRVRRLFSLFAVSRSDRRPPADEYRLVVIGGFGWRDIGDEAMPRADLIRLHDRCDTLSAVMLSPDPAYTESYHRERSIPELEGVSWPPEGSTREKLTCAVRASLFVLGAAAQRMGLRMRLWSNARQVLDELAQADLLFNVGGGNINSVIPAELYRKCTMHLAARAMGIPVVLSGQTIGPFTRRADRWMARLALDRVQMITMRDKEVSRARLAEIGVRRPRTEDTGDDALGLPSLADDEARRLFEAAVDADWRELPSRVTVAVNLKGSLRLFKGQGRGGELGHEVELFAKMIDWLIEVCDAKVVLVPTDFGAKVDDRVLHREIFDHVIRKDRVTCVEDEFDDIQLKALIASTNLAIGARYHFNVFAASEGVPFLGFASGVYQQTKLEGLASLLDLAECYLPLDAEFATFEEVLPYLERVVTQRGRIASDLHSRAPDLVRRSATGVDYALELIRRERPL